jgi:anti-anti-sigma regulatory factor
MKLTYESIAGNPQFTVLHVQGRVDGANYIQLIEKARELLGSGTNCLCLSLEACDYLSSAGLFALHNIALMAHQYEPLNKEDGWGAMREMANEQRALKERFKIIDVPKNIMNTLEITGLSSMYAIYPDAQEALAAFIPSL